MFRRAVETREDVRCGDDVLRPMVSGLSVWWEDGDEEGEKGNKEGEGKR